MANNKRKITDNDAASILFGVKQEEIEKLQQNSELFLDKIKDLKI